MKRRFFRENGSITVEASISLTFFTFVMVCILMFINVGRAQMKLQLAANKSAQQISQYMYILKITGLYNVKQGISQSGSSFSSTVGNAEDNIKNATKAISALAGKVGTVDFSNTDGMADSVKDIISTGKDTASTVQGSYEGLSEIVGSIADNPIGFIKTMAAFFADGALDEANSQLFGNIIGKAIVLKSLGDNPDSVLRRLNIKDGADGLQMRQSSILQAGNSANGADDVNIVIVYQVNVFPLLDKNITGTYAVSASARAWLGGDQLSIKKLVK